MSTPTIDIISLSIPVRVERFKEADKTVNKKNEPGKYVIQSQDPHIEAKGVDFQDAKSKFTIEYAEYIHKLIDRDLGAPSQEPEP
jgi:hypothetical protein